MVPYATETSRDHERTAKATWQAALLRQLADDLEQSAAARLNETLFADAADLPAGTQIVFTLQSGRPPRVDVREPIRDRGAFDVSVHP